MHKKMDMDGELIVVAVDASKDITGNALEWAARNVVKPKDSLILLAILPSPANQTHQSKTQNFLSYLMKKWGLGDKEGQGCSSDKALLHRINSYCEDIMKQQLCSEDKHVQVVADAHLGSVAAKAAELGANWVILDRRLKKEGDFCLKQLDCNIVLIDRAIPKILRAVDHHAAKKTRANTLELLPNVVTSRSSIRSESLRVGTDYSWRFHEKVPCRSQLLRKVSSSEINDPPRRSAASSSEWKIKSYSGHLKIQSDPNEGYDDSIKGRQTSAIPARRSTGSEPTWKRPWIPNLPKRAVSRTIAPPLCPICRHNALKFGKAPRKFSYKEVLQATGGFSAKNFMAQGRYRGVLGDGHVVAVKQCNGASELCSEVEVLSCAQHRNLVVLVGYCIEKEWLLVNEFACNGSLDKHLYGTEASEVISWQNRMKVAVGAARGLRYLHEDCRVGRIVHGDLRPNNILLNHEFEPMVGDFGLATQRGLMTDKADVYAFGVVLLELLSGFNFPRNTCQEFVAEWASPLLERKMIKEMIDPRLKGDYAREEVECMMLASSLCISAHPEKRPSISKVLKILEGDMGFAQSCSTQRMNSTTSARLSLDLNKSRKKVPNQHSVPENYEIVS